MARKNGLVSLSDASITQKFVIVCGKYAQVLCWRQSVPRKAVAG